MKRAIAALLITSVLSLPLALAQTVNKQLPPGAAGGSVYTADQTLKHANTATAAASNQNSPALAFIAQYFTTSAIEGTSTISLNAASGAASFNWVFTAPSAGSNQPGLVAWNIPGVLTGGSGTTQAYQWQFGGTPAMGIGKDGTVIVGNGAAGVGGIRAQNNVDLWLQNLTTFPLGVKLGGATGATISASYRNTAVWNPGTILGGAQATTSITVTGAATGADCIAGVVSPAPLSGYATQCIITAANTCGLSILNQSAASVTLGSATFYCRVFNP